MHQIFEKRLDKIIKRKEFIFDFNIDEEEIYALEITATAKSWWQNLINLRSFFKDDDLTIKIDNLEFPKRGLKQKRLFDGETAFNGNNLKRKKKTDLFLIKLNKGKHILTFLADQKPKIHSIRIYQLEKNEEEEEEINYLPKDNYPIEDGDRRQWLTIVLVNLGLKFLKIIASAKQGRSFFFFKRDDADLKLIINRKIQENQEPKSHRYWYWCGRTLKGKEKTFEKELNLPSGIHYLELWADRSPEVKEIRIKIEKEFVYPIFTLEDIQKYTFKGINGNEDYNRFDKEILEAVNFWNKFFFSQKYPPPEPLSPNLVKAMIYVESRMGYHQAPQGFYPAYPDVMQIADFKNPAIYSLKGEEKYPANEYVSDRKIGHMDYSYPKEWLPLKVETAKESIFWGVRWLYHKAQKVYGKGKNELMPPFKREWKDWKQAVADYNGSREKYKYQEKVWKIYKNGVDPDGNTLWKKNQKGFVSLKIIGNFALIVGIFLVGVLVGTKINFSKKEMLKVNYVPKEGYYFNYTNETDKPVIEQFLKDLKEYKKNRYYYGNVFKDTVKECEKVKCCLDCVVMPYLDELVKNTRTNRQFLEAMKIFDFMRNIQEDDIDNDGRNEIVFVKTDILNRDYIELTVIDKIGDEFQIKKIRIDGGYNGYIKLKDLTGDLIPEILLFVNYGRGGYHLIVYQYSQGKGFKEIFESNSFLFPEYTFSDLDKDGLMEIKVRGKVKNVLRDHSAIKEKIYEYNKNKDEFVEI